MDKMLDCPKCKHELAPGQKFCDNCGERVSAKVVRSMGELEDKKKEIRDLIDKVSPEKGMIGLTVLLPLLMFCIWAQGEDVDPLDALRQSFLGEAPRG